MSERDVDLACVTETWINPGKQLNDVEQELRAAYSLGIISRSRLPNANNGRAYGGVALIYRLSRATFKAMDYRNPSDFEVLASLGKVKGVKGKLLAVSCYAPPNMGSLRADGLIVYLSDAPKLISYTYRSLTPKGAEMLAERLALEAWASVQAANKVNDKAAAYQAIMDRLMNDCFVWRTTTRREDEEPWVDDFLKKLWKRRRKVYDKDGRPNLRRVLSRKASARYAKRMSKFLETQKRNLASGDASKKFFKLVKNFSNREKPL